MSSTTKNALRSSSISAHTHRSNGLKYHKIGNYKEVEGESDTIVFASGNIVGRFKVGDVKYALEVCMDHAVGVVAQTTFCQADEPHVRLLVSSYVDQEKSSTLNDLAVLHSST